MRRRFLTVVLAGAALTWAPGVPSVGFEKATRVMVCSAAEDGSEAQTLVHLGDGRRLVAVHPEKHRSAPEKARPWTAEDAVTTALRNALDGDRELLPVILQLAPGASGTVAAAALSAAGIEVRWMEFPHHTVEIGTLVPFDRRPEFLGALEGLEGRLIAVDVQAGAVLLNDRSAWLCQSGEPYETPISDRGLRGEGQVVALMDTGIDPDSCFFIDAEYGLPAVNSSEGFEVSPLHRKILAVDFWWDRDWPEPSLFAWDNNGHGSHTAGSVAGDAGEIGFGDGWDGMAPAAKLVIQDGGAQTDDCGDLPGLGCPMKPLGPMFEQAWLQGARIHSNSWGDEENFRPLSRYTERTADADRFVWEHPEMVIVAAAGNSGPEEGTVESPSTGKNVLSVGAVSDIGGLTICPAYFSSRGWAHDGRIKPDVMAPGSGVFSAATDLRVGEETCAVVGFSGTSMAAPTVAGLAALVRQYFLEGRHENGRPDSAAGFEPSASLVKATLIASGVDLVTLGCTDIQPIPSREQGWGLVQLGRALWFEGDEHRLLVEDRRAAFFDEDRDERHVFTVVAPGPLKVVLAWTDPPSSSLASTNLINDLDLEVEGPGGLYLGNTFAAGESALGGTADRLNNVEVVILSQAEVGTWTFRVRPHSLPVAPQGYSLVVVGAVTREVTARNVEDFGRAGG